MLDLLASAASTRQIHQGRGASGANPKARVQATAGTPGTSTGPWSDPRCLL